MHKIIDIEDSNCLFKLVGIESILTKKLKPYVNDFLYRHPVNVSFFQSLFASHIRMLMAGAEE